jgi:hypothetical protein
MCFVKVIKRLELENITVGFHLYLCIGCQEIRRIQLKLANSTLLVVMFIWSIGLNASVNGGWDLGIRIQQRCVPDGNPTLRWQSINGLLTKSLLDQPLSTATPGHGRGIEAPRSDLAH